MQYNQLWLWRWLPHSLSKGQSMSTTTVLFRTTITWTIMLKLLIKWLLGSHLGQFNIPVIPGILVIQITLAIIGFLVTLATILVKNLDTLVCFPLPTVDLSITVVSVLQNVRSSTSERERAHYSGNKSVRSKSQEFSRKFKRSGVSFNDLWRLL